MSEEDRAERKRKWRERTIAQYKSYKYQRLRGLVVQYYQSQEQRLADENRTRLLFEIRVLSPEDEAAFRLAQKTAKKYERYLTKEIGKEIAEIPIYKEYLSGIKGLGPVLSGCLIAYIQDIGKFDNISKLHRYCGLSAIDGEAQRKSLGTHIDYNPKLKTLMFKIGDSFTKQKNEKYMAIYKEAHKHYEKRGAWSEENPAGNKRKLHTRFRALKKMERIFLANVWVEWRKLEGLPVSDPWVFTVGGHSKEHMIDP